MPRNIASFAKSAIFLDKSHLNSRGFMILSAVCMSADTADGSTIKMPFGYGDDHGEARRMLNLHFGIVFPTAYGFAASKGLDIVFLNRESAFKHAVDSGQVKVEFLNRPDIEKSLSSDMVAAFDRGNMYYQLKDIEQRMEYIYRVAMYEHYIEHDFDGLEPLSNTEIKSIKDFIKEHGHF